MSRVTALQGAFILDSRGDPTVEATLMLDDGIIAKASVPSGASTGSHEAVELRDKHPAEWRGRGVQLALRNIADVISPALTGFDPRRQSEIDSMLVDLDGTPDRSRLGANAMLAVSVACARAAAAAQRIPLWRHLASNDPSIPLPMINIFSGNLHAAGAMDVQDVLFIPLAATDIAMALEWAVEVYRTAQQLLAQGGRSTLVGDEGGFGAIGISSEGAIELLSSAIQQAGLALGSDAAIAIDVAATHLQSDGGYRLDGQWLLPAQVADVYRDWSNRFPICSFEDPFAEDAWADWAALTAFFGDRLQILGDDLIATHIDRFDQATERRAANAVLVKPNQIGTLSEAMDLASRAKKAGWHTVISARSGETEDDWLADLAVAAGAGQIKVGSVVRSERLAKYNRLLTISREAAAPRYAGGGPGLPR